MKIAYTVWTWMKSQFGVKESTQEARELFEQAVKEVADLGYYFIENFNFTSTLFKEYPEEFERIMRDNNTKFVNIYHALSDNFEEDYKMAVQCCKFLKVHNATLMNLEGARRNGAEVTEEKLAQMCININKIAEMAKEYDVTICVHPHYGTYCETEEQISYLDQHTDPKIVKFCLDTCHCILGKMDPVKIFQKYVDRIGYVHFKDITSNEEEHPEFPVKRCRALGEGIVDFRKVFNVLQEGKYNGIICVEVDWPRLCNYETAMVSRTYLHNVLNL